MSENPAIQKTRLSRGIDLAFRTAGDRNRDARVLLHGLLETHAAQATALIREFLEDAAALHRGRAAI